MRALATIILAICTLALPARAATINVPADFATIQAAINAASDGDEIIVAAGVYNEAIDLLGKRLILRGDPGATLNGAGLGDSIVTIINCPDGTELAGFLLIDGTGKPDPTTPTITAGGGVFIHSSTVAITDCTFERTIVTGRGGAVSITDATVTFSNCAFVDTRASRDGGAIAIRGEAIGPTVVLNGCSFQNSRAFDCGGSIHAFSALVRITASAFVGGGAGAGGSIAAERATAIVSACDFQGVSAGDGGFFFADRGGSGSFSDCSFSQGGAGRGGAFCLLDGSLSIDGCSIDACQATQLGGAIYAGDPFGFEITDTRISNTTFTNGQAAEGGAIVVEGESSVLDIDGCEFENNRATGVGGDIALRFGPEASADRCSFTGSFAAVAGGSICATVDGRLRMVNCTFTAVASARGCAIALRASGPFSGSFASLSNSAILIDSDACTGAALQADEDGSFGARNLAITSTSTNPTGPAIALDRAEATFTNLLIAGFDALPTFPASAIALSGTASLPSSLTLINATITDNAGTPAAISGLNASAEITNSIMWNNAGVLQVDVPGATVRYSIVQGGFAGPGNLDEDPAFSDPLASDYTLGATSPAIDAGDSSALSPFATTDLAGNPRYTNDPGVLDTGIGPKPTVDLGPYERPGAIACSPADLSSPLDPGAPDGLLTGADFLNFLARFQAGDLSVDFSSPANPGQPDGLLSGADFFEFVSLFSAGC